MTIISRIRKDIRKLYTLRYESRRCQRDVCARSARRRRNSEHDDKEITTISIIRYTRDDLDREFTLTSGVGQAVRIVFEF